MLGTMVGWKLGLDCNYNFHVHFVDCSYIFISFASSLDVTLKYSSLLTMSYTLHHELRNSVARVWMKKLDQGPAHILQKTSGGDVLRLQAFNKTYRLPP